MLGHFPSKRYAVPFSCKVGCGKDDRLDMKEESGFPISREKHLDHMVRVVPFIVALYAFQSYVIYRISPQGFSAMGLALLGGLLAFMIGGILTYDLNHKVFVGQSELQVSFFGAMRSITFEDIESVDFDGHGESFSNLKIKTTQGSQTFYFIDDAQKIKSWIEERKNPSKKMNSAA